MHRTRRRVDDCGKKSRHLHQSRHSVRMASPGRRRTYGARSALIESGGGVEDCPPSRVPNGFCLSSPVPPSPPAEKATARQDQAGQSSTDDGSGDKLGSDFTTGIDHGVYVKIALSAQNSRDEVRLGLREPAMGGDEGGIVGRSHSKIEGVGWISPGGHSHREVGKRGQQRGDHGVGAERCAAVNVRCRG
jgi:hypothetical protein